LGALLNKIAKLKQEIEDVECPPDDSMFNQVVVIVSGAFMSAAASAKDAAASTGGAAAAQKAAASKDSKSQGDIHGMVSSLETMGCVRRQSAEQSAHTHSRWSA
jgi:hypothetical protein